MVFNDGLIRGKNKIIVGNKEGKKGSSRKALPQTLGTTVTEIRDHPDHHHKEMIRTQAMLGQIMVEEEAEDITTRGDQHVLNLLTHEWL